MKPMKKFAALLLIVFLTASGAVRTAAEDGNVTYSGNSGKFIFAPGSSHSPTDLFPNFKDVMPGDSVRQRIVVRNNADHKVKVKIYMRSLGAHKDSEAFLSQLKLRVTKVTDTIMFDATADETAQLTDWVLLGTLYSGGEAELDVVLEVPVTLDNTYQRQIGYLRWQFMIEELPIDPDDPQPPTGDTSNLSLYVKLMIGSGVLLMSFLLIRLFCTKTDE